MREFRFWLSQLVLSVDIVLFVFHYFCSILFLLSKFHTIESETSEGIFIKLKLDFYLEQISGGCNNLQICESIRKHILNSTNHHNRVLFLTFGIWPSSETSLVKLSVRFFQFLELHRWFATATTAEEPLTTLGKYRWQTWTQHS